MVEEGVESSKAKELKPHPAPGQGPGHDREKVKHPPIQRVTCCETAYLDGRIQFDDGCIIHPYAHISAKGGPIIFGHYNIIEEKVVIKNLGSKDKDGNLIIKPMHIGSYNLFKVGSEIINANVGNLNILEPKCGISKGAHIGNSCIIGACATVEAPVPDKTVVLENGKIRQRGLGINEEALKMNIKSLTKEQAILLPQFNQMKRSADQVDKHAGKPPEK